MGGCCMSKPESRYMEPVRHMTASGKIRESDPRGNETMLAGPFEHTETRKESGGGMCPAIDELTGSSRKRRLRDLEKEVEGLHNKLSSIIKKNELLRKSNVEYSEQNKNLHNEVEELKTRLSRYASDRLTDNNPDVTDLSDPNRPIVLAEKFSELYCNQWTDAYEAITRDGRTDDHAALEILLHIVTDLYEECIKKADDDLKLVKECMKNVCGVKKIPTEVAANIKAVKDLRKKYFSSAVNDSLQQILVDVSKRHLKGTLVNGSAVSEYTRSAAELCWLLSIQDPPVFMISNIERGQPFNRDLFSEFTNRGDVYDYLVWPALLVEEGGNILHKGVAQPRNSKTNDSSTSDRRKSPGQTSNYSSAQDFSGSVSQTASMKSITVSVRDTKNVSIRSVTSRSSQTDDAVTGSSSERNENIDDVKSKLEAKYGDKKVAGFTGGVRRASSKAQTTNEKDLNLSLRSSNLPRTIRRDQKPQSQSLTERGSKSNDTCGNSDDTVKGNESTRL